jgi:ABC-type multidrug transport system fused ATPase/permease subunit
MLQVAQESLTALRTVQAYNALKHEQQKFNGKVQQVFSLAKREAVASGIFFGSTGWSGNVTLLALLAYGTDCHCDCKYCLMHLVNRWYTRQ